MDYDLFVKLGYKIKYERAKRLMSQLDLAMKAGLTSRTLSRIECGIIDPKLSSLVKISQALNIELTELLNYSKL